MNNYKENESAIYLGDIDPNNKIISAMDIRRTIMFQLLVWDKIILSDSQFLTDPRLNVLMSGYNINEVERKYNVASVSDFHKGIETLFENGFIEVALRNNKGEVSSLNNTWRGMKNGVKPVPYLPEDEKYVEYLMSFQYNTQTYETKNISSMFRENLLSGLETDPMEGGLVLGSNDVETELKRMFSESMPLFRNILDFLRVEMNAGAIDKDRYIKLYDYVYGCYNINISKTLHCNINTKFAHIPFHMASGEEFLGDNPQPEQVDKLRPTWVLNPIFLDYLSFEDFVEIKKRLNTSKIREFYLGKIKSPWEEIENDWGIYTDLLETKIKNVLLEKQNTLSDNIFAEFGIDKFLAKPKQKTITAPIFEIVKSIVSTFPFLGNVIGFTDLSKTICGGLVTLLKRKNRISLAEEHNDISELISKETRVITKY